MIQTIKAIDTRYAGHLFRSRLEARWAVFLDQLGLRWEYEPEGFEIYDGTRYLPDFRITVTSGACHWLEVKPLHITDDPKFTAFKKAVVKLDNEIFMAYADMVSGSPLQWLQAGHSFCPRCGKPMHKDLETFEFEMFCCDLCDFETESGGGNPTYANGIAGIRWEPYKGWICLAPEQASLWQALLLKSAVAAQEARFEHGANPL